MKKQGMQIITIRAGRWKGWRWLMLEDIYNRNIHIITHTSVSSFKPLSYPQTCWSLPFTLRSSKDNKSMRQVKKNAFSVIAASSRAPWSPCLHITSRFSRGPDGMKGECDRVFIPSLGPGYLHTAQVRSFGDYTPPHGFDVSPLRLGSSDETQNRTQQLIRRPD